MTKIIGHRGFSSKAPENTLSSLSEAILIGCDYFELDIQSSRDGKAFVLHDDTLDRTSSNFTGGINRYYSYELKKALVGFPDKFGDVYKNEKLPTLKDALLLGKGKIKICIEIKSVGIEASVSQLIHELKMEKDIIIFSFIPEVLLKINSLSPTLRLLFLTETFTQKDIDTAIRINAIGLGISSTIGVHEDHLNILHQKNLELWMWTINDPKQLQLAVDIGIDGIITDYPNLAKQLKNRKVHLAQ